MEGAFIYKYQMRNRGKERERKQLFILLAYCEIILCYVNRKKYKKNTQKLFTISTTLQFSM
jgi:hypothetical protein